MKALPSLKIAATVASLLLAASVTAQTGAPPASMTSDAAAANGKPSETVGERVSDATVTTKAKAKLMSVDDLKASGIHVKTRRGVVTLTGTVPSSADKQRAQESVEGLSGVRSVRNRLRVVESGASQ